ncbi:hypothetical protein FHT40_001661 [Mycolicibacterium sp. BK556]|uniref:DUF7373 family lipoprotein n=1 Tax=unclassified Mycolicibacterium TaxID=2636767 RepID=UPI0016178C47|nr:MULTISPECIES: hypothetical protein [unclassified Mycolicibacterium]MBB3602028.1 hypothetical protein [Mycolicibacterium sp. BK556]MBB3631780.1 hypothetical protein [Mycolicibacterium sp. BK607]
MTRPRRAATVLAAFVLGIAGCSPVTGVAVTASPLDVGPYPTTPVAVTFGPAIGSVIESQSMAASVVLPTDVDTSLRRLESANTGPVSDAQGLRSDIRGRRAGIAEANGFVAGFSSARSTEGEPTPTTSVVNLVMRFPNADAASAAAREMVVAEPARPVAIAHHRETLALFVTMPRGVIVESFTPRGPYVLYQWVQTRNTLAAATGLVSAILDLQGPRVDALIPTDPALLVDASRLMARTLPPAVGVYSAPGALHFEADPVRAADRFAAAGVTAVALGRTTVYRAESAGGAALLIDRISSDELSDGAMVTDAVGGAPDVTCVDRGGNPLSRYGCHGVTGSYAFTTTSAHAQDARQQAAAQYLLLGGL